ncbi:MAG: hypothetical protein JW726_15630 [Anaerolineales bacterium]|nr:hypothetical protein [Anaerolineales bacterium]
MKRDLIWVAVVGVLGVIVGYFLFQALHLWPVPPPVVIRVLPTEPPFASPTPGWGADNMLLIASPTPFAQREGPLAIATILIDTPPVLEASPTPLPASGDWLLPTPVPDHVPGWGMQVLPEQGPYIVTIVPGGWQAYGLGPAENPWGYLVDITPLEPSVDGAYVEYKILPEYDGSRWVDVLWLQAPGIVDKLPVQVDLIPTKDWQAVYQANITLAAGDWMGFGMFSNAIGCGGVLDISPYGESEPPYGSYIQNTRVQPEYPGEWVQVARVQLLQGAPSQPAQLTYYTPGSEAEMMLQQEVTLAPATWNGFTLVNSQALQGYVVEVVPLNDSDNEIAESVVRPEFDGVEWRDVLRIYVPESRPPLDALVRVLAVAVP